METITAKDRDILRELAKFQLEVAHSERNIETIKEWYLLNSCKSSRPLIHIELDTFEHEIVPKRLKCQGEASRLIETQLYKNFLNFDLFKDDKVVANFYEIPYQKRFTPFNLEVIKHQMGSGTGAGHEFGSQITSIDEFADTMEASTFSIDKEGTLKHQTLVDSLIGDILPTKITGSILESVLTQDLVHLMKMEDMFLAMYDSPGSFKKVIDQLADDYIRFFRYQEEQGIILPTNGHEWLNQGSLCYNNFLPNKDLMKSTDIWGFMDSQETVGVSPDMFKEFVWPAYKKVSDQFGRLSYGCCEPVDSIWDDCLSKQENLGKVSISPWCNQELMADRLKNSNIVYHRKPSPNFIGVPEVLDEKAFKAHISETLITAKGCTVEFTQRDVYTVHNNENKVKRYIEIIREAVDEHWE